jgi:hypothetical protein
MRTLALIEIVASPSVSFGQRKADFGIILRAMIRWDAVLCQELPLEGTHQQYYRGLQSARTRRRKLIVTLLVALTPTD